MLSRRWPDVVIALAIAGLAGLGVWALWGEDLGLRSPARQDRPATITGAGGPTT